jgi:integrase
MPRAYELTWDKALHRWVKVIQGKKYYFSGRVSSKASREDYLKALGEYRRLLPEILAGKSVGSASTRQATQSVKPSRNPKKRLAYAVAEYHRSLDERTRITKGEGGISKGRAVGVKGWLKSFTDFMGAEFPARGVDGIDEEVITKYRRIQREARERQDLSPFTVFQRFAILKNFLRYCWSNRLIDELPRNLNELQSGIPAESEILFFDWRKSKGEEVRRIIDACRARDEFLYLCVLLGLNCGFTLKDINDLKTCDFRWKTKSWERIERNRSKSGQYGSFVLWQETVRLLKKHMVKGADYNSKATLLVMPDGRPVMDQKGGQFDSPIAYQFKKVVKEIFGADDRRSFKTLRKTGATYCVRRERGTEILYLAHKPKTMAARFYAQTPVDSLDRVLCWMEEDFGLTETLIKRYKTTEERTRSRRELDEPADVIESEAQPRL